MGNLFRLSLLGYLLSWSVLAKTDIPVNMDGAEKYFTQEEMDRGQSWLISFDGGKEPHASKIPFIKLYSNKEVTGLHIGEINKDGMFLNGKKRCHFEKVWGGMSILIDENSSVDKVNSKARTYGDLDEQRRLCEAFPLRKPDYDDSGNEGTSYDMRVRVFNGKVGRYTFANENYYFELKEILKESAYVEKDTETILKENLSDDEMKALNKSLVELRDFLKTATLEQLYERVRNERDASDALVHERIFSTKNKKLFFDKIKTKDDFIYRLTKCLFPTYVEIYNFEGRIGAYNGKKMVSLISSTMKISFIFNVKNWELFSISIINSNK
ncbi:hypothetical protein [Bacteriovorax sp. Seq25_V]|uniref:hypothetical protein n=1 Tax=Bacteriovorax sp. Seq25_V TaxID=1201288 RepID=UPI00038A1326|nr:hypothetical protein [Bacteriovorax sp. Seq25_V]EQC44701.1 hypothetical protein M900_0354 [Bacteriovorax sp. Seq25_V]